MSTGRPHPFDPGPPTAGKPGRDRLLAAALLAVLLAARILDVSPITALRLWNFDAVAGFRPAVSHAPAATVVDIDDASLSRIGQWPWPRDVLADVVDRLSEGGASVVVLDMLLSEPDRTSVRRSPASTAAGEQSDDHDSRLAAAMRRIPVVSGVALSAVPLATAAPMVSRIATRGVLPTGRLPHGASAVRPLPALERASRGLGVVNLYPDIDSAVRTVPGVATVDGVLVPGIAVEAVRVALQVSGLVVEASSGTVPEGISVGGRLVPTDMNGRIRIDASDPGPVPVIAAWRLLSGEVAADAVRGQVVVVGVSASGLGRSVRLPGGAGVPTPVFQAMAIDSILSGRIPARPVAMTALEVGVAVAIGVALIVASPWLGLAGLGLMAVVLVAALPAAAAVAAAVGDTLADASFPLLVGLCLLGEIAVIRLFEQGAVRRRQAAMLAAQDAYMRQVVDASFDAIITVDRSARVVTANAGARRLLGVPEDGLLGRPIGGLLQGAWSEALRARPEAVLHDAVLSRRVVLSTVERPDGGMVPVELTVAETATPDRAFVFVLRDISARIEAEASARQAAERLRDGIDRITDGFALFGRDRRLVICNTRFVDMLGEAGAAARPGETFDLIMARYAVASCGPVDAAGRAGAWLEEHAAAFLRTTEPRLQERLDGRWFRIDERPTAEGGLVGVYTDITELKWREMEMSEAMLRAEAASSAKSEFLANMSHELRTPLNAVIGFADLMQREMLGPLGNDQYRAYVGDIIDSGSKLLNMIEVILEFSRSEHAHRIESDRPVVLDDVVETVLRDVRPAATDKGIPVEAEAGEGLAAVSIDEAILYQILQNLVSNAIKFSAAGSPVRVRTYMAADGRPAIAVRDRGIGIPADMIGMVTQPFWQRQGPLVRSHGGVGLGLAIVKSHLDAFGGELLIESVEGQGTTATVLLPSSRLVEPDAAAAGRAGGLGQTA